MNYMLKSVSVKIYPVLSLEFADGFKGELDLSAIIAKGEIFAPLQDKTFFTKVVLDTYGYSFDWRLDDKGNEIDFSAEGARIDIETAVARKMANDYNTKIQAAE